jgi:hypothetical protein
VWPHTWRKNLINCAVLKDNSAGLRTVLSSRLSHRELRSSLTQSHSFLSLPAETTMASSQGTPVSSYSFSRWTSLDIFLCKYHFLLHILRFFLGQHYGRCDQQTTALFLSTIVTRRRSNTELTKKMTNLKVKLCCAGEHSVQFFVQFFFTQTAQCNLGCMGPFRVYEALKDLASGPWLSLARTISWPWLVSSGNLQNA